MERAEGIATGLKDGAIGWVTFDNPDRMNALSSEMAGQALDIVRSYATDKEIRVVVLRGAGNKAFVSGADISKFKETRFNRESSDASRQNSNDLNTAVQSMDKPVIAMIHGYCLGGGMALAVAADVRLASTTARLGIPAAKRGIAYPPDRLKELMDIVGPGVAKDVIYSGRQIESDEALRIGLINRVFERDMLERETLAYATLLAENAPLSISASKFCIRELLRDEALQDRARMQEMVDAASDSEDFREATNAFIEKRRPHFRGL